MSWEKWSGKHPRQHKQRVSLYPDGSLHFYKGVVNKFRLRKSFTHVVLYYDSDDRRMIGLKFCGDNDEVEHSTEIKKGGNYIYITLTHLLNDLGLSLPDKAQSFKLYNCERGACLEDLGPHVYFILDWVNPYAVVEDV